MATSREVVLVLLVAALVITAAVHSESASLQKDFKVDSGQQRPSLLKQVPYNIESPPLSGWPYTCVWNSPTELCTADFGLDFNLSQYLIAQNPNKAFDGSDITIFYGIGVFPKIDRETGAVTNGGIPQLGNLTLHLDQVRKDVDSLIADENFNGLAVIDFEAWRPLFKHNFDTLDIYQKASEKLVEEKHPEWTKQEIEEEAEKEFNAAAKIFFEATVNVAKQMRPHGYWGYYGFPRCYGNTVGNFCLPGAQEDNNRLYWLWDASTALYPSIYLPANRSIVDNVVFLMSTVHEGVRVANNRTDKLSIPVYPYSKHTYRDDPGGFYSMEDLWLSHAISSYLGSAGVVIWGSSSSMATMSLCTSLQSYITATLGPFVKNLTLWAQECSSSLCNNHGQCVATEIPQMDILDSYKDLDSLLEAAAAWLSYFTKLFHLHEGSIHEYSNVYMAQTFSCKCYNGWTGTKCQDQS